MTTTRRPRLFTDDQLVLIHNLARPFPTTPSIARVFSSITPDQRYDIISRLPGRTRDELVEAYRIRLQRIANEQLFAYLNRE